jgi:hypothetical protein
LPDGAPEARPLPGVEVTRPGPAGEAELGFRAFQPPPTSRSTGDPRDAACEKCLIETGGKLTVDLNRNHGRSTIE